MSTTGSTLSHQAIDDRCACRRGTELRDLDPAVRDQERLSVLGSLREATQVLPHVPNADPLHVRQCSAVTQRVRPKLPSPRYSWTRRSVGSSAARSSGSPVTTA